MSKVALITGGTRGIGYGIASSLAELGFRLAVCGRRPLEDVATVLEPLHETSPEVVYFRADLAKRQERLELVEDVWEHFGLLDILVNNAGVAPRKRQDLFEATEESYDRVMDVNLKSAYFLTQDVARRMVQLADHTGGRSIINITSISSTVPSPSRGEYCISKAGMSMATQLWAVRLAEFGINVYEIRPGLTLTDMTSSVKSKYDELIEQGLVLQKRWGMPEDIGKAVAAISRGDFPYSTGHVFMVDGGMIIKHF